MARVKRKMKRSDTARAVLNAQTLIETGHFCTGK